MKKSKFMPSKSLSALLTFSFWFDGQENLTFKMLVKWMSRMVSFNPETYYDRTWTHASLDRYFAVVVSSSQLVNWWVVKVAYFNRIREISDPKKKKKVAFEKHYHWLTWPCSTKYGNLLNIDIHWEIILHETNVLYFISIYNNRAWN